MKRVRINLGLEEARKKLVSFFNGEETHVVFATKGGNYLFVSHGERSGAVSGETALQEMARFCADRGAKLFLACCYPSKVAGRLRRQCPGLPIEVLGGWRWLSFIGAGADEDGTTFIEIVEAETSHDLKQRAENFIHSARQS